MKKRIENIKKQYKSEGKKLLFVLAGFVSGRALAAGMNMLATQFPDKAGWLKYGKAPLQVAGALLITSATTQQEEFAKYFGYGLGASAVLEGIKITPLAKDYLDGVDLEKTYYREDKKPALSIGDFGMKSLPIKSVELGDVKPIEVELPELESAETSQDLGYSSSITNDDNLGYSGSITDPAEGDNVNGII